MAPKAPKRQSPIDVPTPASSDDEEEGSEDLRDREEQDNEESESEEEEEEEEEEGGGGGNQITPSTTTKSDPAPTNSASGSESGSDSDVDSDQSQPSPAPPDFTVKPIASKHPNHPPRSSKPSAAATFGKRAAEAEVIPANSKAKKRKDVPNGGGESAAEKGGNQWVWSDADEIALLKGMIEFRSSKGTDPYADMVAFYEFLSSSMQCRASKSQLIDKIRRLKKKYQTSVAKGLNGEDLVFSKPQERKLFQLAKKIWGPGDNPSTGVFENGAGSSKKQNKSAVKEVENESNKAKKTLNVTAKEDSSGDLMEEDKEPSCGPEGFWAQHPCLKASLDTAMFAPKLSAEKWLSIFGKEKAKHLEKEFKSLQKAELEQLNRKLDAICNEIEVIVNSCNHP